MNKKHNFIFQWFSKKFTNKSRKQRSLYFVTTFFVIITLLLLLGLLFRFPGFLAWRGDLLSEKLHGHFPNTSWYEVGKVMLPQFIISKPLSAEVKERDCLPCPVLWRTAVGSFWGRESDNIALDTVVIEQILGLYQQGPVRVMPGDIVFDIGGHLGAFTRVALDNGASKVVVFEPEPTNITCFKKTFAEELRKGQVILIELAAWEAKGVLNFAGGGLTFRHIQGEDKPGTAEVQATTIDAVAGELGLASVDYIKMDIEGSERNALMGAKNVMAKYGPRLAICIYHYPDDRVVIPRIILEARPSYRRYLSSYQHICVYYY